MLTTPDAGTAGQAPQKTLEDIRREIDAEYQLATTDHLGEPDTAERLASRRPVPRGDVGRRGQVMAAAIGCIAGQVLLVVATASAPGLTAPSSPADDATARSGAVARPAPVPRVDPQLEALRTQLDSLAAKLERAESRVTGVESRIRGVESSVRRLGDDVPSAAVQARRVEDAVSAPRQIAAKQAPPAPLPAASAPVTARDSEPALSATREPLKESSLSPETPASTADSARSSVAGAPSGQRVPSSDTPLTLVEKLRGDWRTIKQGLANAGDDFKTTMHDFARKVRGE